MTRRTALAGMAAAPVLAMPAIVQAAGSKTIKIGLVSDLSGPYRDVGGIGNKVAVEMAIADFGGSVLGRKIEILQGDCLNKPDVAAGLARRWIDTDHVDVLADGAASSSGLGVQQISREKKVPYLITGPASSDFTGKFCSPYSTHWAYDTYALAHVTGGAMTKAGGNTWYFITADYAFGYALERDTITAVEAAGGKVLGKVRAPLGTPDFSSFLVQARASKAKVVGLANAGTDTQNCIKQAAEFGITQGGQKLATLLIQITDINSLGQKICQGLTFTDSFYWAMTPKTIAWSKRYMAKMKTPPGLLHAGNYAATLHWLQAVKAVGTTEGDKVVPQMKATLVNDFYNHNVKIREDGRVLHEMYLWEVKPVAEAKFKYDFCKNIASVPGDQAYRPMSEGHCPFIKA
ncbi:MAG: ABC transporter substrate-binding protein [Rhodospirillales bacterium]|nr:ABC transporter substrate-binding protein [Rhodospirillales bacterium]